ncbi:MAG TPA: CPBP family intramembrane metalloprotease [Bryobacteraceae bacterium]|nr:CPBP family intramembrane metalloprotease [Bryobacteraceae bacterium]HOQ44545.1 CPBP family intramembrane metalloprotease [Bryobacteraceae bacterium]HPU70864.1 CPBP family intramembrane metalloprotease [Bryobacteraceae bacterium]
MGEEGRQRDWDALLEAVAVFVLIMIYIWWLRLWHAWLWMPLLAGVMLTHWARREHPRRLGFLATGFRQAFAPVLLCTAGICAALLALGALLGTIREVTPARAATGVFGYVGWGLFQQYLLNGYFVNRLAEFAGNPGGQFAPVSAAVLFSLAHLPNWFLMPVTLAGGYVCARVYLRYRNLYALAIAHGLVGYCLYSIVPDSVSAHFLVGPRYLLEMYGTYPEVLL